MYKHIYKEIGKMWNANPMLYINKSVFPKFLGDSYATHLVVGIRRQIKVSKQSISLMGLLEDIATNPRKVPKLSPSRMTMTRELRIVKQARDAIPARVPKPLS